MIFGTRGARGALDTAHLEILEDEVAEFHTEAKQAPKDRKPRRRNRLMELDDRDYQQLLADRAERDRLKAQVADLEETAAKVPDLEKKVESAEAEATAEKKRADDAEADKQKLEEQSRVESLRKERFSKLGSGFVSALGEFTKGKLEEQAGTLDDAAWEDRLKEIEETAKVKRDAEKDGGDGGNGGDGDGDEFSDDEISRSGVGGGGGGNGNGGGADPKPANRRAIVGGLVKAVSGSNK